MKILLVAVNAKFIHTNLAVRDLRAYALAALAGEGVAAEECPQLEIAEYTINQIPRDVLADIWRRGADAAAFSCYIWNIGFVETLLRDLRKICPEMPLWAGGPEVTYDAEAFLRRNPAATGVIPGEGEAAFAALVRLCAGRGTALAAGDPALLAGVPGIVFRTAGCTATAPAAPVSLDAIPFVYGLPDADWDSLVHRILYYESSRGCPFRCSYCLSSLTETVRFRSLELVLPELQFFLDRRVPQVKFVDRTLNCRHSHTKAIWRYLAAHDNGVTNFHFEIEADLLDEEELELLAGFRPGQVQLEIGVQSTHPATLREIRRHADAGRLQEAVRRIGRSRNVHRHLDLIAGLPFEDYGTFRHSFNEVYGLRPEQLQMGFLKVLKGSHMEKMADSYGLVSQAEAPYEVLGTRWLPFADVQRLKELEAMLEIYGNSGQYRYAVAELIRAFPSPFDFFEALAAYHREAGLTERKLSRTERMTVLRDFFLQAAATREECRGDAGRDMRQRLEEKLILDLYLRENSRSSLPWEGEAAGREQKEVFRSFYRRAASDERLLEGCAGYDARALAHMTHAAVFRTDVLDSGRPLPLCIVFDYRHRDPITHDARLVFADDVPWREQAD